MSSLTESTPNPNPDKWTEITLLPEWEEKYYLVYTAKKHGKWVMLKTLKPEYTALPEFREMIEKEFDVRYNLAHPNIVMINDFEDVPGLGRCIITDDVYGDSLRKLIDENRITPAILDKLQHELVDAIDYIQANHIVHHPIRPETIVFTENVGNLKLIDVGYDQAHNLEPADADTDIQSYGRVLDEVLDHVPARMTTLRKVAARCTDPNPRHRFRDVQELHLALERRSSNQLYIMLIAFMAVMIVLLAWLNMRKPSRNNANNRPAESELIHNPTSHPSTIHQFEIKKQWL